ncbi:hypothetical protein TraAM80_03559 [Trypanosoma rangeli]|uniref:Uncharacterized protein n=1 Tax=Trypanosoma rangeli TaxID=5698 RepID=A0A3R7RMM5_TRYRA|nr:uncharacterized protein TraAM80_03559 [Trypanosoma rangeli]RNF07187.1 hypothetical protein TraAM80_03559 [Trypanosoma rangeli]|eukprot:RNF07187.1 hypothetical protein TraAM80_03559 [Trypanosoma rangeli]
MSDPADLRRAAAQRQAATKRRRQRLLSASDNGAIVEYEPVMSCTAAAPSRRISLPPRHTLTRPQLFKYYRLVTGGEPFSMQCDPKEEGYNYSWFTPASTERRKKTVKGRRRLQEALVVARDSRSALEGGVRGVFDSGHLYSPICRRFIKAPEENAIVDAHKLMINQCVGNAGDVDTTIILVQPVAGDLPTEEKVVRDELLRVAPKGREWDRQHALRHVIGPTAQEAIIDSCIDPRYRLPGDYVRRNGRGVLLDARGRPMRVTRKFVTRDAESVLRSGA